MSNWEEKSPLVALTHLDGRNAHKLLSLRPYFSEYAWMKVRLRVMCRFASQVGQKLSPQLLTSGDVKKLDLLEETFSLKDADSVVLGEKTVNHDLKALELFLAGSFKRRGLSKLIRYLNLGIGSEDINSIALAETVRKSREEVIIPALKRLAQSLIDVIHNEKDTLMIARTHAQPANVTTFGKEIANSLSRLCDEVKIFRSIAFTAKCSGEVGSFQAFIGANRSINWIAFTDRFITSFELTPSHDATQIAPYDSLIRYFQSLYRINNICIDFSRNIWLYVLLGYLKIKKVTREVGSAGMPHKVNPIYFEGAEGGLEMANGILETLSRKLSVNRLQRDFSDSTLRRNIVLPFAYSLLSFQSLVEGLNRIEVHREVISSDLRGHAEVWIETIKAYGITHGIGDMYERLKYATRGRILSQNDLGELITTLPLKEREKQELASLCDGTHNPYPVRIVNEIVHRAKKVFT